MRYAKKLTNIGDWKRFKNEITFYKSVSLKGNPHPKKYPCIASYHWEDSTVIFIYYFNNKEDMRP